MTGPRGPCGRRTRAPAVVLLSIAAWGAVALAALPSEAATRITLSGPAQVGPVAADPDGRFAFPNVPLRRNSVNVFTITATDDAGTTVTKAVSITQLSLESVVASKFTVQRLTVQEIQQLVDDGVVKLDDPTNFNVSRFDIVLTIGGRPVAVSVPIVAPKTEAGGSEVFKLPRDVGADGGAPPVIPENHVIVFEQFVTSSTVPVAPIPGVLIIEGRIKTLKELFSARLLLLNTSGIFTLRDVTAGLSFPDGGLANTLPVDGMVSFGAILPGTPEQPGQLEREFIFRGDAIGVRRVRVDFGGVVTGPGIPEDAPVPFNGSAMADVEVKGPPAFRVLVRHPPGVEAHVPYELVVDITNTGPTPALYASLALEVGADGRLVACAVDAQGEPGCTPVDGAAVRNLGHLLPGQTGSEAFTIEPLRSGPITSCLGIADQNIGLQVAVGAIGCLVGRVPPDAGTPAGIPTVTVVPVNNALGVGIDAPVTAFFSRAMDTATITTGTTGTFDVFDDRGARVPGRLRFATIDGRTVAIWQVDDGVTNRLAGNTTYRVVLATGIRDLAGNALASTWSSSFTTTSPTSDVDPPTLALAIEPPVDPSFVLPGQLVRIGAHAADQGTGVARVELRVRDVDVPGSAFALRDQKTLFDVLAGPIVFAVDSGTLVPGHTYQFKATAFDGAGNAQDATIALTLAASASPPTIELAPGPGVPVLQGIAVTLSPAQLTGGVKTVDYFLDDAPQPARTVTVAPFQAAFPTLALSLGPHRITAVARDALGQTGRATFDFTLAANPSVPVVRLGGIVTGADHRRGTPLTVTADVQDPVGLASVRFFLDDVGAAPIATGTQPFTVTTTGLALGSHRVIALATNALGVSNDVNAPTSFLTFNLVDTPVGPPPPPPAVTDVSAPAAGQTTVQGTSAAGARIDVTNVTQGLRLSVSANGSGAFAAVLDADVGDVLRLVAVTPAQSAQPSEPTSVTVPAPRTLASIAVAPASLAFTAAGAFADLVVTGTFTDGSTGNVTARSVFTPGLRAVASVNAAGRVVAVGDGASAITVRTDTLQTQVPVSVAIRRLVGLTVDPVAFTLIGAGASRQLTVTGRFSDETTGPPGVPVTFASSDTGVATATGAGLVTSRGAGAATISAAAAGLPPAQATVTVGTPVPTGIAVSPSSVLLTAAGQTQALAVTQRFSDGSTGPASPPPTFETSHDEVATVDDAGVVTAVASGEATITVRQGAFSATVAVAVDIPPVMGPPVIASIDRPRAGEGDPFVIRGQDFAALPEQNRVTVSGLLAQVTAARRDELVAIVPRGATTGPVVVSVASQASDEMPLAIYPRRARAIRLTSAIDAPGAAIDFGVPDVDVRAGDRVFLSSAPDVLAPLDFDGTLTARVDGGPAVAITEQAPATEITSLFTAGVHALVLELEGAGGHLRAAPIFLVAGPDGTGPLGGERFVLANGQSRPTAVTFTGLPVPDGGKVAVTALGVCFREPLSPGTCIASDGGTIANGEPSPSGLGLRAFTVVNGRVDVVYDPVDALALAATQTGSAAVQVIPADAEGRTTAVVAIAVARVTLTTLDTAATPATQSSVIADGASRLVTVTPAGFRDTAGNAVPDGTPVVVTPLAACFRDPTDPGLCVPSAGGAVVSGEAAPGGLGLRTHVLAGGQITVHYDPGALALAFPDVRIANLTFLPARPGGAHIGVRAFVLRPITLSSARTPAVAVVPPSVLADDGDHRVVVTFSGITDALGAPVPDGVNLVFTPLAACFRHPESAGTCIASAGGTIVSGTPSPSGLGLRVHQVRGARVDVTYSTQGVALGARESAVASVQGLPATPDGRSIGVRAFALAEVRLTGYQTATTAASPGTLVADGVSKTATVTFESIRDTEGNLVPDGAVVAVTALGVCFRQPDDPGACIPSVGGSIVSGTESPDGLGLRNHVVAGGQVTVHYDPGTLVVTSARTANVQALPARPSTGRKIGIRAFAVAPITLTPAPQGGGLTVQLQEAVGPADDPRPDPRAASGAPRAPAVLADGANRRLRLRVGDLADVEGQPVPDGTIVLATAEAHCFRHPTTNECIASAGGRVRSGRISGDGLGLRVHRTAASHVDLVYDAGPVALEARSSAIARVQLLPGRTDGSRIGDRAFEVLDVVLAGYQHAVITGPGRLAPGAEGVYTVTGLVDTAGRSIPDGAAVAITAGAHCFRDPEATACIPSDGGAIVDGEPSPDGPGLRVFRVQDGAITVTFRAPEPAGGTAVLQLLPARPATGARIGDRAFATKAIVIGR